MNRFFFIIMFFFFALSAKSIGVEQQKEAVRRVWMCYAVWSSNNASYVVPANYTYDEKNENLTGQLYYSFSEKEFDQFIVDFSGLLPLKAGFSQYSDSKPNDVKLKWEDSDLINVEIVGLHRFKYAITKSGADSYILYNEYQMNGTKQDKVIVYFSGDKISTIEMYGGHARKKDEIFYITTYTFPDERTYEGNRTYYKKEKVDTKIYDPIFTNIKKIESPNKVSSKNSFDREMEYTYNEDGYVVEKRTSENNSKKAVTYYEYVDEKIFRKTSEIVTNGVKSKEILVMFDKLDADTDNPDWEWRKGKYCFDEKGDLIYETKEQKYRKKIDGVWSEWMFIQV